MTNDSTYPNPLALDSEKNSPEYGLRVMKAAYDHWNGGNGKESASQRKRRFDYNRTYASGQQDMQEFKDILDLDGDMSVVNLDYSPIPIAPAFLERMDDRFMQRIEKIQCNTIDPLSQTKREKAKADQKFKLKEKERIMALQNESGVQVEEFKEDDPADETELDLRFGFTYKQREEVIMEQGIDLIFYDNNWPMVIKKRIFKDLKECGVAQVKPFIDQNGRIKIRFSKPENIIASYTDWDDFRDCQIQGEIYDMSIMAIRMLYPKKITEEKLFELAKSKRGINGNPNSEFGDWNPNFNTAIARPYDNFKVPCVELDLKTIANLTYESKEDSFGKEILKKVQVKKEGKKYIDKPYEVDYTGVWIVDTEYLLDWGLSKNMIKPKNNLTEVKLPWVTYMYNNEKMSNKPLVETMIPSIKMMQLISLQEQKIIAAAAPDGFKVDISSMSDINLGDGMEDVSPFDLYKIYKQTGVQYYKGIADSDEQGMSRQEPIQPMNVPFSGKLEQLMSKWNQEYDKLMRIIGTNNLDSGNIQNQAVGKGVLQEARQTGESSTNYLYLGYLNMMERTAKICKELLSIILFHGKKYGIEYYDGYRHALDSDKVEYVRIEGDEELERADFDVKIQAVVDDKEAEFLERNIEIALDRETIDLDDAIRVRQLARTNIKYALYELSYAKRKRKRDRMEEAQAASQSNTEAAVAAANAKADGDAKLEDQKFQNAMALMKEETEALKTEEIIKFNSILKTKVIEGMLTQGANIQQIQTSAPWVFAGIGLVTQTTEEIMQEQLQDMQEQGRIEQQQALQQQQLQAQQEEQMMQQGNLPQEQEMVA